MIRIANAEEREQENTMQRLMFKINVGLFVVTVVAVNIGKN